MQLKIFDIGILKEWIGTSGEFFKVCAGPGLGAPSDDPKVLTKWLVSSMYVLIITYLVNIGYFVLGGGGIVGGLIAFVQYAITAFIQTWVFWYAFAKREPPCCCLLVVCIEDWKPMHLIMGVLLVLSGVLQAINSVLALLTMLANMTTAAMVYAVFVAFYCLYAVTLCGVGLCLVKIGGKKAGVDVPGGAPSEQVGA
jgi:hypothetical protein